MSDVTFHHTPAQTPNCPGCGEPRYTNGHHVGSKQRECLSPDPGEITMTFYRGNRTGGEFTWPIGAVCDAFMISHDREKAAPWPLDRVLREWLSDPEGFDSSWTDELKYDALFGAVLEAMRRQR